MDKNDFKAEVAKAEENDGDPEMEEEVEYKVLDEIDESFDTVDNPIGAIGKTGKKVFLDHEGNPVSYVLERKKKFDKRGSGRVQDFYSLRQQCIDEGNNFEDPDFPTEDSSLFFHNCPEPVEWKRPHEITSDPQFFIDGPSRFDVKQGRVGDCWFLAAVASLTLNERLFNQVVPKDQGFGDNYAGIFHFRFWQYGRWVDVVIDDRLPTSNGYLLYMCSEKNNEFWSALVEKAYAKLYGSYKAISGGYSNEAMADFTGCITETITLSKAPPNLFNIMLKAYQRGSLMECSSKKEVSNGNEVGRGRRLKNGLISDHAYSVTMVKYYEVNTIRLIRIRNPWGHGTWGDLSSEWWSIPTKDKEEMGLTLEHDGEFWMTFNDFTSNFGWLTMAHLDPAFLEDEDMTSCVQHKWEMHVFEGAWNCGSTAGGCRNYKSFASNPQYRITLTKADEDDDDNKCTVIVDLMQKNRRKRGRKCRPIAFSLYHLRNPDDVPKPLDSNFFKRTKPVEQPKVYNRTRQVFFRFKLPPGTYCIIPSTFEPNKKGKFLLRVFSEKANDMEENDENVGFGEVDERVKPEEDDETYERLRGFFSKVAGDDLEIDWDKLQDALNFFLKREFSFDGFSEDICRSMVAMLDVDRSGKLGLQEFVQLWTDIKIWKNVFKLYDEDHSGQLCSFTLRQALNSAGYRLNNHVCNALMLRYGDNEGRISFDNYILCITKLKTRMEHIVEDPEKLKEFIDELMAETEEL